MGSDVMDEIDAEIIGAGPEEVNAMKGWFIALCTL
jgi:hypothetical protein